LDFTFSRQNKIYPWLAPRILININQSFFGLSALKPIENYILIKEVCSAAVWRAVMTHMFLGVQGLGQDGKVEVDYDGTKKKIEVISQATAMLGEGNGRFTSVTDVAASVLAVWVCKDNEEIMDALRTQPSKDAITPLLALVPQVVKLDQVSKALETVIANPGLIDVFPHTGVWNKIP
jgi:hypothetical protein